MFFVGLNTGYTGLQWWELIPVVLNPCDEPCYDRILVILLFPLELENIPLVTVELLYFGVSWGRGFTLNPHLRCLSLSYLWVCACAQSVHGVWLCDSVDCSPPGSLVDGNFPGKKTGVSCHSLLQGIFPTQGWNLCLLPWPVDSLPPGHLGRAIYE